MFIPNLMATFSNEQLSHWLPQALSWQVIGAYCQTELGHGSNVRALETTFTYISEDDQFEVHSPTITSTKWWPGALGHTANHGIVYGRLILNGQDLGVHNFMVQLREFETHQPCKGIKVGDIGPKIGYNNQDNGFCSFDRVRIPRQNMAMRHASVSVDGKYTAKASKETKRTASYSTMTRVRGFIVAASGNVLSAACAIAVRYSIVRRQGFIDSTAGTDENKVLDYTIQQHRLLPLVATTFAFHFTGAIMHGEQQHQQSGAAMHIASSGLKALCSRVTADGIEACRKACGGHGYLETSGLPSLLGTWVQNCTVEGENFMIAQQTTRGLIKILNSDQPALGDVAYIRHVDRLLESRCAAKSAHGLCDSALLIDAFTQRAAYMLVRTAKKLAGLQAQGCTFETAWNKVGIDVIRTSEAHSYLVLVSNFANAISQIRAGEQAALATPLESCFYLFALHSMAESNEFVSSGYLSPCQVEWVQDAVQELLAMIRPDAIALVDAWGHSDHRLNSALGRYDGDVYSALLKSTSGELNPMNAQQVHAAFHESVKPLMQLSKL